MTNELSLLALVFSCFACASALPPAAVDRDGKNVMNELRARLDDVARARAEQGSEPKDFGYGPCPLVLTGVAQTEVLSQLGRADRSCSCSETARESEDCRWEYSFYYLPSRWAGGGPKLELHFNRDRLVSKVKCVRTQ